MRTTLHSPRQKRRSIAAATLSALAILGSLLVATPAQALNDTGTGGVFVPATSRFLDTGRNIGGYDTAMPAKGWRTVKVTGVNGVPDDGSVGAISVVATAASITGQGILNGRPDANTSSTMMGIYGGDDKQNTSFSSVLAVSADGTIQVQAETSIRLILDLQGYYTANTDGTAPGGFVPLNGTRIADTRSGLGLPQQTIGSGERVDLQVTGRGGIPKGASGVIINMIAVNRTASTGYLTPYATGDAKPSNSFNYAGSVPTSMQAQVKLSADGKITIYNSSSTTDLVVDNQGYFTAAGTGGAVFTPGAGRAYDTRTSGNTALGKNETRSIQIAGKAGVPVMGSGINAVVLSLTSLKSTAGGGSATVWADGTTKPNTTSINFEETTIRTNTITVPLGANGKIAINNVADVTNYVFDVQGWYANPTGTTVSCDGYANGAWADALPETVTCTATTGPATATDEQLSINGDDGITVPLSGTAATTASFTFHPTLGTNIVNAYRLSSAGEPISGDVVELGFGRWTDSTLEEYPADGASIRSSEVELAAIPSPGGFLPDNAQTTYTISATPDMANPVWQSAASSDAATVPADVLQDQQDYYWTASVTGATAGKPEATLTSSAYMVHINDSVSSDTLFESEMSTMIGGGPVTKSTKVISKTSTKNYIKWSKVIGACIIQQTGDTCSVSLSRTKTQDIQTAYGLSNAAVAAQLNISVSDSTSYTTTMTSKPMKKGQKYTCSPVGTLYKYKIQKTVYTAGKYSYPTSGWLYTFNPYSNQVSCKAV